MRKKNFIFLVFTMVAIFLILLCIPYIAYANNDMEENIDKNKKNIVSQDETDVEQNDALYDESNSEENSDKGSNDADKKKLDEEDNEPNKAKTDENYEKTEKDDSNKVIGSNQANDLTKEETNTDKQKSNNEFFVTNYDELKLAFESAVQSGEKTIINIENDIKFTTSINVTGKYDVIVNGQGHTLSEKNSTNIFYVSSEQTLTITNATFEANVSGSSASPIIYGQSGSIINLKENCIFTNIRACNDGIAVTLNGGICNMYNGVIIKDSSSSSTGAISIHNGTFNMYGGTIKDIPSTAISFAANPIGPTFDSGTFNMYGGLITNCKGAGGLGYGGGAICVFTDRNVNINIYGGTISNCTYNGSYGYGGAIFFYCTATGIINISGGTFTDNIGKYGGFMFLYKGIANITGGLFKNNQGSIGGAIANNTGTMTIGSNVIITENSGSQGGGVISLGGTLTIEDRAKIYNNTSNTGSDIAKSDSAKLILGSAPVGIEMTCGGVIDGWYSDALTSNLAWNHSNADGYCLDVSKKEFINLVNPGTYTSGTVAIKAAHGKMISAVYVTQIENDEIEADPDTKVYQLIKTYNHLKEGDEMPNIVKEPTKEGYKFVGWYPEIPTNVMSTQDGSMLMYEAIWQLDESNNNDDNSEKDENANSSSIDKNEDEIEFIDEEDIEDKVTFLPQTDDNLNLYIEIELVLICLTIFTIIVRFLSKRKI